MSQEYDKLRFGCSGYLAVTEYVQKDKPEKPKYFTVHGIEIPGTIRVNKNDFASKRSVAHFINYEVHNPPKWIITDTPELLSKGFKYVDKSLVDFWDRVYDALEKKGWV